MVSERQTLKPCPFCGGEELVIRGDDKVVGISCQTCGAFGPNHYDSRFSWTTRALTAAAEVKTSGLSEWQGWEQGREGWAAVKHQDRVCAAVFGPTWSMEDADALISFIGQTWGKPTPTTEGEV